MKITVSCEDNYNENNKNNSQNSHTNSNNRDNIKLPCLPDTITTVKLKPAPGLNHPHGKAFAQSHSTPQTMAVAPQQHPGSSIEKHLSRTATVAYHSRPVHLNQPPTESDGLTSKKREGGRWKRRYRRKEASLGTR